MAKRYELVWMDQNCLEGLLSKQKPISFSIMDDMEGLDKEPKRISMDELSMPVVMEKIMVPISGRDEKSNLYDIDCLTSQFCNSKELTEYVSFLYRREGIPFPIPNESFVWKIKYLSEGKEKYLDLAFSDCNLGLFSSYCSKVNVPNIGQCPSFSNYFKPLFLALMFSVRETIVKEDLVADPSNYSLSFLDYYRSSSYSDKLIVKLMLEYKTDPNSKYRKMKNGFKYFYQDISSIATRYKVMRGLMLCYHSWQGSHSLVDTDLETDPAFSYSLRLHPKNSARKSA